jgi:hypothetical protein
MEEEGGDREVSKVDGVADDDDVEDNDDDDAIAKKKKKYDSSTSALSRLKQTKEADPEYRKAQREAKRKAESEKKKKLQSDKAERLEKRLAIGNNISDNIVIEDNNNNNDFENDNDNMEKKKRRRSDRRRRRKDNFDKKDKRSNQRRRHHRDKRNRHRHRYDSDSDHEDNNYDFMSNTDSDESINSKSQLGKAIGTLYQQIESPGIVQLHHHHNLPQQQKQQHQQHSIQQHQSFYNNPYMNTTPYTIGYGYLPPTDSNMLINSFGIAGTVGTDGSVPVSYPSNFGYQSNNLSLQQHQHQQQQQQQQQQLPPVNNMITRTLSHDVNFSSDDESPNESLNRKLKSLRLSDQSINRYHNTISSDDGHSVSSHLSIPRSILNKSITLNENLGKDNVDSSSPHDDDISSDMEIKITHRNNNRINRSRNHNRSTSDILSDIKALSAHLDDFIEDDDEDDDTNDDNTLFTDQMPVRIPNNRHLRLGGDGSLNEMLHYVAALENEEIDDDVAHFVSNMKENKKT